MQTENRKSVIDTESTVLTQDELDLLFDTYNELKQTFGANLGHAILKKISKGLTMEANKDVSLEHFEMYYKFIYLCFKHAMGLFGEDLRLKEISISNTSELKQYNATISNSLIEKGVVNKQKCFQRSVDAGGINIPIGAKWSEEALADLIRISYEFADPNLYPFINGSDKRVKWFEERLAKLRIKHFEPV